MVISQDLKDLVSKSVRCLGEQIRMIHGEELYEKIEKIRKDFKETRKKSDEYLAEALLSAHSDWSQLEDDQLEKITHSFSLMMELINACEMSFRILSLKKKEIKLIKTDQKIIYVLTGHPTEARSKNFLLITEKIIKTLESCLVDGFEQHEIEMRYLLRIALQVEISKHQKPKVRDEAVQIYQMILSEKILEEQVRCHQSGVEVSFRTWVGGDKDGHPGVGPREMLMSLSLSRKHLLEYLTKKIVAFEADLALMSVEGKQLDNLKKMVKNLKSLNAVKSSDGKRIEKFKNDFYQLCDWAKIKNLQSVDLEKVKSIIWLYPALVMPLELREDSEEIHKALKNKKLNIAQMLVKLKAISKGFDPKWYVRGFIVSMCCKTNDLIAGIKLLKKNLGAYSIPVVPLFENEQGLVESVEILNGALTSTDIKKAHLTRWSGKYEVMLGYSDSSKENGVLAGRVLLEQTIHKINKFLIDQKLVPVFFHGSGGSISRGGGSTKEQIAWWPKSSLKIFKMTIQGESIQRNLGSPIIMHSQIAKIEDEYKNFQDRQVTLANVFLDFSKLVQHEYKKLTNDDKFHELVFHTTPYQFLSVLKLGSRPAKRSTRGFSLRAIPWILCWTQSRLLLPVWWGIGSAWTKLDNGSKIKIIDEINRSSMLTSFIKNLGFTLEKIEFGVWLYNLEISDLSNENKQYWRHRFEEELQGVESFFSEVTNHQGHVWFRPWLEDSIMFRSSMIHPLNVMQRIAVERKNDRLLRLTVTGISSGMMTTG